MTYREIGRAVALLLEERQDIHASSMLSDQLMALNDKVVSQAKQPEHVGGAVNAKQKGAALVCSYCHVADDHFVQGCPKKAAEVRGEYDTLMARYRASGLICPICKTPGHEQKHHMLALNDYRDAASPGKSKTQPPPKNHKGQENQKGRGKGSKSGKGAPAEAPCVVPPGFVRCEWGKKCFAAARDGKCNDYHPSDEWKQLMRDFQQKKVNDTGAELAGERKGGKKGRKGGGRGNQTAKSELQGLTAKEGVHAIGEAEPKAKAKAKPKLVSGIGGDKYDPRTGERISTISDEVRSIQEQITHYNTGVDRIYNTMELSDYFSSKPRSATHGATCSKSIIRWEGEFGRPDGSIAFA